MKFGIGFFIVCVRSCAAQILIWLACAFFLLVGLSAHAQQCTEPKLPERDLYILIGQSNAAGLASVKDLVPPAKDYISANANYSNVQIYGVYGATSEIAGKDDADKSPAVSWSKFARWETVKPGFGFKNLLGNERYFPYLTSVLELFGPELPLAHYISKDIVGDKYILKLAISNTALAESEYLDSWTPGGHLYKELMSMIFDASLAKSKVARLKVAAIFFMHGESDSMSLPWANAYEKNLKNLIERLRADIFKAKCSGIKNIPFVMTRVQNNEKWIFRDAVRRSQEKLSRTLLRVKLINTDDLSDGMAFDGVHFNKYGQMRIAERFYFAIKEY
ncbi:sialate O-acetylesterase [Ottowia testudinis]|uniref:Sialate O-acetylesterase domain-containing protein n=1 Tax=Ottowia testudinis TaxID=2816950 RepID=A0A975H5Y7_9BURK|nr:sialate O-acetylesterase [Ottowia testudinis]QTD45452.1 hypothetical protein J1M35_00545 [Ottowia testudinis]